MIRLTIELYQEPELPDQWVSKCVELDILVQGRLIQSTRVRSPMAEAAHLKCAGCQFGSGRTHFS